MRYLLILCLFIAACGPSFVQTGPVYPALPENAPVGVFLVDRPAAYEEIGVVEIKGGELATRVKNAQKAAREHGGDAVFLVGAQTGVSTSTGINGKTETSSYSISMFAIVKLKTTESTTAPTK